MFVGWYLLVACDCEPPSPVDVPVPVPVLATAGEGEGVFLSRVGDERSDIKGVLSFSSLEDEEEEEAILGTVGGL